MRIRTLTLVSLLAARFLGAQGSASARLEGTVTDSVRGGPLAGAWIFLTRRDTEPPALLRAVSDDKGRYRFENLSPGAYSVGFGSESLDSLDLVLPEKRLALAAGQRATMDFATPSGATLRAAACPGLPLAKGQGAVVGYVVNADDDRPMANASVVVSWQDVLVDRTTLRPTSQERSGVVAADSTGRYRVCGVPTENFLLIQVQRDGQAGLAVRLSIPDDVGFVVQTLSLSRSGSRSIASLDSARSDTAPGALLRGSAELSGVVRAPNGQPLGEAQVRVLEAAGMATTDPLGRFSLRDLPGGTQVLEVKRIGYLVGQLPVQLRNGTPTTQDIQLVRIVNLDSVRVVAERSRYGEFEENKRSFAGHGRFLTQTDIDRRRFLEMSELIHAMGGFRVEGSGLKAKVFSTRGSVSLSNPNCEASIVIDGMTNQVINLVSPSDVGAIELYRGVTAPGRYSAPCGTIMIWTKR